MTDFLKIAKSIVVHFAHICAYGVETVKDPKFNHDNIQENRHGAFIRLELFLLLKLLGLLYMYICIVRNTIYSNNLCLHQRQFQVG